MDATLILIDGDAELLRSRARRPAMELDPSGRPRPLEAQARLVAAYEEMKWPRRPPSVADLIRHLRSARPHPSCSASEEAATMSAA